MKRRTLTLTLCILACVALIGVGFASWVITNDVAGTTEGTIEVDTVEDKVHIVTVTKNDDKVVFGPDGATRENAWLTDNGKTEQLEVTITIEVTNYATLADTTAFEFDLVANGDAYEKAVTAGYVKSLDAVKADITVSSATAKEGETSTGVYTITIKFGWGTTFEGKNPSEYYNALNPNDQIGTDGKKVYEAAATALNALHDLSNTSYTLTIKPLSK